MGTNLIVGGFLLMLMGGVFSGVFSFPLKYTPRWSWENAWGAGSLLALILLPWPLAFLTVPGLCSVYQSVPVSGIILALLFGAGWGTGGIFFGKGLAAIGFSIGMALIMGIVAIGGSVIPLAMNQPDAFRKLPGMVLLAGVVVMVVGLVISARAGILKEADQMAGAEKISREISGTSFRKGLIFCILAGLLSSLLNFGFIYGSSLSEASIRLGTNTANSQNALLALVFTSNFLVNIGFCTYLLIKNKTFKLFIEKETGRYWIMAIFMGLFWTGGIIIYGMGTTMIGGLGAYLGFPLLMVVSIITANVFGVLTGEWKGVSTRSKRTMGLGILVLVLAIIILGWSLNLK